MALIVFAIIAAILVGALLLVMIGLREGKHVDPLQERMAEYAARGETVTLEEIELSQPISERIIYPMARKFGELAIRFTPQNAMTTGHKLELAAARGIDPTVSGHLCAAVRRSAVVGLYHRRASLALMRKLPGRAFTPGIARDLLNSKIQRRQKET
jgi:hypothetical protein